MTVEERLPSARRVGPVARVLGTIGVMLFASVVVVTVASRGLDTPARAVFVVIAVAAWLHLLFAVLPDRAHRRRLVTDPTHAELDVAVLVPVYNEDPGALRRCLRSFLEQTRRPQTVVVVDDGSTAADYDVVRAWFLREAGAVGVRGVWHRTVNQGKRHAQVEGVRFTPGADVYVTVDSDSILDHRAIANGLQPFADPRVQSVAALILTTNYRQSLLARWMDVYCLGLQLFERSAFSRFRAVMVNSGGCSFYRAAVIRDNLDTYLGETILGRPVQFSDDSMLTLFALRRGRAVQREDCFAFTLMPATLDHHVRQQVRWMRGSFIRSIWRMRYLPLARAAYWLHLVKWMLYVLASATLLQLLLDGALFRWETLVSGGLAAVLLYVTAVLRYVFVIRSDQGHLQRWLTFATAPLAAVWGLTVLRVMRWYAIATFARTEWGTRGEIEVRDGSAA
ncbi:glycosyltransferase [Curtobacterium sp. NPDC087082]|uniref:glycosyltransferase n=1 Tax=Curtobacterium sp. NPDC087082 TaxID=3363966 RepID=UPI00382BE9B5